MNYFIPVYYLLCLAIEYIISPLGNTFVKSFLMFKYIPVVGIEVYMDAQFERARRCNIDYEKAGHSRKTIRYQTPPFVA